MKYKTVTILTFASAISACLCAQDAAVSAQVPAPLNPIGQPLGDTKPMESIIYTINEDTLPVKFDWHVVLLNQIGYDTAAHKRFTAPRSPDKTKFYIRTSKDSKKLFEGEIGKDKIGDFTDFKPVDSADEYLVVIEATSTLKAGVSDPFVIESDFHKKRFWQLAVDFLVDSRSVVGTHPSAFGGCPWRDGTYYDFIIPSLVLMYLSDNVTVENMPKQIDWAADKARINSADFKYDPKNPNGGVEIFEFAKKYYDEIEAPAANAPDVVKLIHWGLGYYTLNPATRDPSGDILPRQIHSQTLEQMAYALWAYPAMKSWIPKSLYEKAKKVVFDNWERAGCLDIDPLWSPELYGVHEDVDPRHPIPLKGRHAPGHSIVPNLLMYEIALADKKADAEKYLSAAINQADWIVKNMDWKNPYATKGHRMSEHRTIPNLVWLLQKYPGKAPVGLRESIKKWCDVVILRSQNMWDFRCFNTIGQFKSETIDYMNEAGNLISFPACAIAASWAISDTQMKSDLSKISTAQVDNIFGRNPKLCAGVGHPKMGWDKIGVDRGWPRHYTNNVCARLETVRGSIDTSCGSEAYPFYPNAKYRHAEGWVNYGASWITSLAYINWDRSGDSPAYIRFAE